MIYLELFLTFVKVGLFSIGGGLAALPLIEEEVVNVHGWISYAEFTDLITISQMTPGPIAINASTFIGTRIAGAPGAIIATLGSITPSLIIVSLLAYLFNKHANLSIVQGILKGLKPAIVALIASAGMRIFSHALTDTSSLHQTELPFNYIFLLLFAISLVVLRTTKFSPIRVMMSTGVIGGLIYLLI